MSTADILTTMPFANTMDAIQMAGETLLKALENSVARIEINSGAFLQFSGKHKWIESPSVVDEVWVAWDASIYPMTPSLTTLGECLGNIMACG